MTGEGAFSNAGHLLVLREERHDVQKTRDDINDAKLKGLVRDLDGTNRRIIICVKITGSWLNIQDTTVTGTVLAATEFINLLYAHYYVTPPNL